MACSALGREFIRTRIPDGGFTTVYRNGDFVDLCRGPHLPYTTMIQAFNSVRTSATNWLGKVGRAVCRLVSLGSCFPSRFFLFLDYFFQLLRWGFV